jgi:hypothetical protein
VHLSSSGASVTAAFCYFSNEFPGAFDIGQARHIQFWSDITEGWKQGIFDGA